MSTTEAAEAKTEQIPLRLTPENPIDLGPVFLIEVDDLPPNDHECMDGPDPEPAFVGNVADYGVLDPIWVVTNPDALDGESPWLVRAGTRRLKAARKLVSQTGITTIPAREILNGSGVIGDTLALISNAQRRENPLADLAAIERILERAKVENTPCTYGHLMRHTGLSIPAIKERLNLRTLSREMRVAVGAGHVPMGVARKIAKLPEGIRLKLDAILLEKRKVTGKDVYDATRARKEEARTSLNMAFLNDDEEEAPRERTYREELGIVGGIVQVAIGTAISGMGVSNLGGTTEELPNGTMVQSQIIRMPSGRDVLIEWKIEPIVLNIPDEVSDRPTEPSTEHGEYTPEMQEELRQLREGQDAIDRGEEPAKAKRSHKRKRPAEGA